jgi:3-oxoadipate enol-lactonase
MIPHHVVTGPADAPTLVLSNSIGSALAMWDGQARLAEHYRVVRYDTRGHGLSDVPPGPYSIDDVGNDVIELLDKLDVERVHFAGLSLGGMTGMWLALNHPHRLDRLVVLCTAAHLPGNWIERAALVREQGIGPMVEPTLGRWFVDPALAGPLRPMLAGTPAEGYAGCCELIAGFDVSGRLGEIAAPTLAIAGAQDPATPPAMLEQIAAGVQNGRLEILDPGAHLVAYEQPEAVTDLILEHLR